MKVAKGPEAEVGLFARRVRVGPRFPALYTLNKWRSSMRPLDNLEEHIRAQRPRGDSMSVLLLNSPTRSWMYWTNSQSTGGQVLKLCGGGSKSEFSKPGGCVSWPSRRISCGHCGRPLPWYADKDTGLRTGADLKLCTRESAGGSANLRTRF